MKKLATLLLALVLAATLCCGALAEAIDYTGEWVLTTVSMSGMSLDAATLGLEMSLLFNEDGTCAMSSMGETENGTWVATETGVAMTDTAGDVANLVYADGTLSMSEEGMTMVFVPANANVLANLTLADFDGTWVLEYVVTSLYGAYSAEDLDIAMTVKIQDGAATITMATGEQTVVYNAICEIQEADNLGTLLLASFLNEAGQPDGSGMMFLLYDVGPLVWYDYDQTEECEYFYCFNLVTE